MPKELHEIKKFVAGTIMNVDNADIPQEAAQYSLNVDPMVETGKLKGIPEDKFLANTLAFDTSGTAQTVKADDAVFINDNDDNKDLIYLNKTNSKIEGIKDLYNSSSVLSLSNNDTSAMNKTSMEAHNQEVHIGTGGESYNIPKWVGYVNHSQFGSSIDGIKVEDAELKVASVIPFIHKAVYYSSHLYGITRGGTKIYDIDLNNDTVTASNARFVNTQSICMDTETSPSFFVLDLDSAGKIYKIPQSDINATTYTGTMPSTYPGPDGSNYSDIEYVGTTVERLFIAAHGDNWSPDIGNELVWVTSNGIASGGAIALSNCTPSQDSTSESMGIGQWIYEAAGTQQTSNSSLIENPIQKTYRFSLIRLLDSDGESSRVGWICKWGSAIINSVSGSLYSYRKPIYCTNVANSGDETGVWREVCLNIISYDSTSLTNPILYDIHTGVDGSATALTINSCIAYGVGADGVVQNKLAITASGALPATTLKIYTVDIDETASAGYDYSLSSNSTSSDSTYVINALTTATPNTHDNGAIYVGTASGLSSIESLIVADGSFPYSDTTTPEVTFDLVSVTVANSGAGNSFSNNKKYFWKISFTYDSYQESPLSSTSYTVDASGEDKTITITINDTSALSERVSAINLYRASALDTSASVPDTLYRLVKEISLNYPNWDSTPEIIYTDSGSSGASYEAINGMAETLESTIVHYGLSTQVNGMLIVGDTYVPLTGERTPNILFRSKSGNFDQFDWSNDFLRLPTKPIALTAFNGRIYAFSENATYRIDPNSFILEDIYEGVGCLNSNAVAVSEYGMCFVDKNNIYLHDGKTPVAIGEPILRSSSGAGVAWQDIVHGDYSPQVIFCAEYNSFLIFFENATGSPYLHRIWAYNLARQRFDQWDYGNKVKKLLAGKDGQVYIFNDNDEMVDFLADKSSIREFIWRSQNITLGYDTHNKRWYKIKITGDGNVDMAVNLYNGDTSTPASTGSVTGVTEYLVPNANRKAKSLQLELSTSASTAASEVDSIGVLWKRLPFTKNNI